MSDDDIADRLTRLIETTGPIPVAQFMAEANAHYYASRDPLGANGDFITAPEISQMFGEMIGLWLADLWKRAGEPKVRYVELGPGRGTLAQDALRAMKPFGLRPPVHFVETNPALRAKQAELIEHPHWHDDISKLPHDRPLLIVANEFFDVLPVRQLIKTVQGWRERMVGLGMDGFASMPGAMPFDHVIPPRLVEAEPGSVVEASPASATIMGELARRLAEQGGAAVVIDYGYFEHPHGDTLQAVHAHAYADPFARPGASDLTAHVDFGVLREAALEQGVATHGPVAQGEWLETLGIGARMQMLTQNYPQRAEELAVARRRLTDPDEMGDLFRVLALTAPGWPEPDGF